jgi:ankyrin repeat protein
LVSLEGANAAHTSIVAGGIKNTAEVKDWWKKKRRNNQDLLFAAENGIIEEVKALLDKNGPLGDLAADVNARGLDQWTALHFAANEGKADIVSILLGQSDIDIDSQSTIGRSPLHLASIRGHMSIVRMLVSKGANKNAKDFDENTPLHHASEFGHFEVIIFMIKEAFADWNSKNKYGYAPSDIA